MEEQIAQQTDRGTRVGIVVIHGIGEAEPGYCVNSLVDSLAATIPDYIVASDSKSTRLPDPTTDMQGARFPAIVRQGQHKNGSRFTAFEMHWADLTRPETGSANATLGMLRFIFESHHLVYALLDNRPGLTPWLLRKVLAFSGWVLRGPITALLIATSALCGVLLFTPDDILKLLVNDAHWMLMLTQGVLALAALWFLIRIVRHHDLPFFDTTVWLVIISMGLLILDYLNLLMPALAAVPDLNLRLGSPPPINQEVGYVNGLYRVLIWGWRFWAQLTVLCVFALVVTSFTMRPEIRRCAISSLGLSILQFMLWIVIITAAISPIVQRAESNFELQTLRPVVVAAVSRGEIHPDTAVLKVFNGPALSPDWIYRLKFICAGFSIVLLIFLLMVWVVLKVRAWRLRSGRSVARAATSRARRLVPIFTRTPVAVLPIIGFVALIGIFYIQSVLETTQGFANSINAIFSATAILAISVPRYFDKRVSQAVRLARDAMNHFYNLRLESNIVPLPGLSTRVSNYPRRQRIRQRLGGFLDTLVRNERFDHVVFVAHSQGSVIALDYLRDDATGYAELGGATMSLLTVGSPIGTVYQRYFYDYDPTRPASPGAVARLRSWINLWRVDDGIGGAIEWPNWITIQNHLLGPGGHTNYWGEPQVALALDEVIQRTNAVSPPPPLPPITPVAHPASPSWVHAMRGG